MCTFTINHIAGLVFKLLQQISQTLILGFESQLGLSLCFLQVNMQVLIKNITHFRYLSHASLVQALVMKRFVI